VRPKDYWRECVASSFDEHGIVATPEQVAAVAADVQASHESYGTAFYHPPSPLPDEIRRLKSALADEHRKVICQTCRGSGEERSALGAHVFISACFKCNGEGWHFP
jgi:hypothetical protein